LDTWWSMMRWGAVAIASFAAALLLPASAAFAHAAGTVPQARLSADGPRVLVDWWAAGDDVAEIGVGLDLLPEEASLAFQGVGDAYPTAEQETRFARSAELRAYLLANMGVTQDGEPCDATVFVPDEVIAEGVRYEFTCRRPVEQVAVRITLLHDRDEQYRTYSIDGTVWSEMHTVDRPEHVWDATLVPTTREADGLPLLVAGIGLVVVGGGVVLWWTRASVGNRSGDRQ